MTEREHFYQTLVEHKNTGIVPNYGANVVVGCGGAREEYENGPAGGGFDAFGVRWEATDSAGGALVPMSEPVVLTDITAWEDQVKFPNVDKVPWKDMAQRQLTGVDRNKVYVNYSSYNAQFLRLTHLMGFIEGLCAFNEEPEACMALLSAITDYRIRCLERIAEYFHPDFYTPFDDVATHQNLFISPQVYREFIKPQHKRVNDVCRQLGILPIIHTCGKCEEIIPDFIEEGFIAWTAAQPMNDIAGIIDKYGDRFTVIGGYDSNGLPGTEYATDEQVEREVMRCIESYGGRGSYIFMGLRMGGPSMPRLEGMRPVTQAYEKYRASI